jgi:hypothetical protein
MITLPKVNGEPSAITHSPGLTVFESSNSKAFKFFYNTKEEDYRRL